MGQIAKYDQDEYVKHWIRNLVSDKLILSKDFKQWILGFEDRYTNEELNVMMAEYETRFCDLTINLKPPVKILELVVSTKSGQRFFVTDRKPDYRYEEVVIPGEGLFLIATDGPLVNCYKLETPIGRFKAFAGREFDIHMKDGTVKKANGQWWDEKPNYLYKEYYSEGIGTLEDLTDCFVFCSNMVKKSVVNEFLATNPIPKEYNEYQSELYKKKAWRKQYDQKFETEEHWEAFYTAKKESQIEIDKLQTRSHFLYCRIDAAYEYYKKNAWDDEEQDAKSFDADLVLAKIMIDLKDGKDRAYKLD